MRLLFTCVLACAVFTIAPTDALAQARGLGSPWRGRIAPSAPTPAPRSTPTPAPIAPATPTSPLAPVPSFGSDLPPVQDIHPGSASVRVYGDGRADEVTWSDPELDLRPSGYVHGGLFGMGGVIAGTSHAPISPDIALGFLVDFALEPHLSLHLRVGGLVRGRFAGAVLGADGARGEQASLSGRGFALLGAHFFQVLALRVGFEVGGSVVLGAPRANDGVGWAAVAQLGVRFDDGHLELVIDGAMDSHELVYTTSGPAPEAHFGDQPSPRLLLGLIGEFG